MKRAKRAPPCGTFTQELIEGGWWISDDGWRHPNLNGGRWAWPESDAALLAYETHDGRQGLVYDMLRGEAQ